MNRLILFIVVCCAVWGCRREEPTRWNVDADVPLAYGSWGLGNLIADSLLEVAQDGMYHLVLSENITDFDLDTLVAIEDTLFRQRFVVPFQGGPFSIPPDFNLISFSTNHEVALNDVELKEVLASGGTLQYAIKSYVNGYLTCTYSIPGLSLNGVPTFITANTQPASPSSPFVIQGSIDLAGYTMNLTGEDGSLRNKLYSQINVRTSANAPSNASINGMDSVVVDLRFIAPKISYAKGYFGSSVYEINQEVDFSSSIDMPTGMLNLPAASLALRIENYVGADARLAFNQFAGLSEQSPNAFSLEYSPLFSTINITRATDFSGQVVPTVHEFLLNESNSNIHQFISSLPERLVLNGSLLFNPLGDVSDGNDFIYTKNTLNTWLDVDIPLRFSASQMLFRDTIALTNDAFSAEDALLAMRFSNTFPLDMQVNLKLVKENGALIQWLAEGLRIPSAEGYFTPGGILATSHVENIGLGSSAIEQLKSPHLLVVEAWLNTPQFPAYIALRPEMRLTFSVSMSANVEVSYD